MVYTEIKEKNGKRYYYRVRTVRNDTKFKKSRIYIGRDLSESDMTIKVQEADKKLNAEKAVNKIEKIKHIIITILKRNKIKKAGIFGSYARGEQKKDSDIDILVEPAEGMGFAFAGLGFELEKALKKKVDLVSYNGINKYMKDRILSQEVRVI